MHRVRELAGAQAEPAVIGLAARVQGRLRELEQAKGAGPVQQVLMHAGEVDLF